MYTVNEPAYDDSIVMVPLVGLGYNLNSATPVVSVRSADFAPTILTVFEREHPLGSV